MNNCLNKPVIYMHIAKTAGSSINFAFKQALGSDLCLFHVESELSKDKTLSQIIANNQFISGHFFYGHMHDLERNNYIFITSIRDPYKHFASHLQWLDSYNYLPLSDFVGLSEMTKDTIRAIKDIDLFNVDDLDHFLTNMPESAVYYLDNLQTRYLIGDWSFKGKISLRDAKFAENHMYDFDKIIFNDSFERSINSVFEICNIKLPNLVSLSVQSNISTIGRRINVEDEDFRLVVSKCILADLYIYKKAKEFFYDKD
jgi:hypothetical protein